MRKSLKFKPAISTSIIKLGPGSRKMVALAWVVNYAKLCNYPITAQRQLTGQETVGKSLNESLKAEKNKKFNTRYKGINKKL